MILKLEKMILKLAKRVICVPKITECFLLSNKSKERITMEHIWNVKSAVIILVILMAIITAVIRHVITMNVDTVVRKI